MHYFGVSMLRKWFRNEYTHSTPLASKWCLGVLWSISQTYGMWKDEKLVFRAWIHYFRVPKLRKWFRNECSHSTPLDPKWCLGVLRRISENLRHVKRCKTCVSGLNALFRGIEVAKMVSQRIYPFKSNRPKMMFGSAPEHFANLRHVKNAKLVFRAWMHYFGVSKLRKWFRN